MDFSKAQLVELQKKFGENYVVLCASQTDAGIRIGLMSMDGGTAVCTLGAMDDVVTPERIEQTNAKVCYQFSETDELRVDACDMTELFASKLTECESQLSAVQSELEECKNALTAMRERECSRRVSSAKEIAKATLDRFNANRDDKIGDEVLEAINADIDAGVYTNSVDADGAWIGDTQVTDKVLSVCASAVMEMDKETAQRRKTTKIWQKMSNGGNKDDNSVEALLSRKGIV